MSHRDIDGEFSDRQRGLGSGTQDTEGACARPPLDRGGNPGAGGVRVSGVGPWRAEDAGPPEPSRPAAPVFTALSLRETRGCLFLPGVSAAAPEVVARQEAGGRGLARCGSLPAGLTAGARDSPPGTRRPGLGAWDSPPGTQRLGSAPGRELVAPLGWVASCCPCPMEAVPTPWSGC